MKKSRHLTWSHYVELLKFDDIKIIQYYIEVSLKHNLSVRDLRERIKNKEYERLSDSTKEKFELDKTEQIQDFIKNLIIIRNTISMLKYQRKFYKN